MRHHALEVTHVAGQGLHLAEAFVHLLQALTDLLERLAQSRLECLLEFVLDDGPHLLKLGAVVLLNRLEPLLVRGLKPLEAFLEGPRGAVERGGGLLAALGQAAAHAVLELRELAAQALLGVAGGLAQGLVEPVGEPLEQRAWDAPALTYIDKGTEQTGAGNIVTAVLLDYRGYDTLGEATVLFTAVVGAVALLRRKSRRSGGEAPDEG